MSSSKKNASASGSSSSSKKKGKRKSSNGNKNNSIVHKKKRHVPYSTIPKDMKAFAEDNRSLYDSEVFLGMRWLQGKDIHLEMWEVASIDELHAQFESDETKLLKIAGIDENVHRIAFPVNTTKYINFGDNVLRERDKTNIEHWLAVLIDTQQRAVLIVDPLRGDWVEVNNKNSSSSDCSSVAAHEFNDVLIDVVEPIMRNLYGKHEYEIGERCLGVQRDNFNCGIWVLDIFQQFAENQSWATIVEKNFKSETVRQRRKYWSDRIHPPPLSAQPAAVAAAAAAASAAGFR